MTTARPEATSLMTFGRRAWAALWWLVAIGGCTILLAAVLSTL